MYEMSQEIFFIFEKLLKGPLVARTKYEDGNITWHDVAWLQYRSRDIGFFVLLNKFI